MLLLCLFLTTEVEAEEDGAPLLPPLSFLPVALTTWGGMSGGNLTALATLWARLMLMREFLCPPAPPSRRPILLRAS